MTLNDFTQEQIDRWTMLRFKKLCGDTISIDDQHFILLLNQADKNTYSAPDPLPQNVLDAMDQIDKLCFKPVMWTLEQRTTIS